MRMPSKAEQIVASAAFWELLYAEKAIGEGCKNNNSISHGL
jgi:hypothetical protein